ASGGSGWGRGEKQRGVIGNEKKRKACEDAGTTPACLQARQLAPTRSDTRAHQRARTPTYTNHNRRSLTVFKSLFCQAEDGIRDKLVTGVQTCALPISTVRMPSSRAIFAMIGAAPVPVPPP